MNKRNDLSFDIHGYAFIALNNIFTAANGIYTKKKLDNMVYFYNILKSRIYLGFCKFWDKF